MTFIRISLTSILLSIFSFITAQAQEIAYGFKAGLNFAQLIADSELDDAGMDLESFTGKTGFHVGATFTWKATDLMGLRGEFLFSQKGYKRRYNGPSYYNVTADNGDQLRFDTGNREMFWSVANSYIDIPIMGYAKPFKWLEVYVGANVGFLISSTAIGDFEYRDVAANGSPFEVKYDLDYRYGADGVGDFDEAGNPEVIGIGSNAFTLPNTVGAYYEYTNDEGNYHRFLDFGVLGGLSFFLNESLYISGRVNYGLTDVTRNEADFSLRSQDASGEFIQTDDDDRNFSIQASVGFSF